jgi:hypothetical protein
MYADLTEYEKKINDKIDEYQKKYVNPPNRLRKKSSAKDVKYENEDEENTTETWSYSNVNSKVVIDPDPDPYITLLQSKLDIVSEKYNLYITKLNDDKDDYDIRILVNIDFNQNNNYNKSDIVSGIQDVILLDKKSGKKVFTDEFDYSDHDEELLREIPVFKDILDKITEKINKNNTKNTTGGKSRKKQTRINKNKTKKHK